MALTIFEMFASVKRPFYNSTQTVPLERLDRAIYRDFCIRQMASAGMKLKSLSRASARLLKAIAKAGRVKEPTGKDFLVMYSPGSPSTIHQALKSLLEDEILCEEEEGIVVYDRLFGIWLSRLGV